MSDTPTLWVCHGDDGGPKLHPCRRVIEAMNAKGIPFAKVVGGHGHRIPFLRKGSRDALKAATGDTKLPTLQLADGSVLKGSRPILRWVAEQS